MGTIATLNGTREPKDATRRMIEAAAVQLFELKPTDVDYSPISPEELAAEVVHWRRLASHPGRQLGELGARDEVRRERGEG